MKNELITENVADKVDRPKKSKYLVAFYSKEELAVLFEATRNDSISVVIQLAAYHSLRRSEVLGIRWSAVDFDRGTISINHKVTDGKENGEYRIFTEDKLKTKSSFRILPLIPAVREFLQEQREKQERYRALFKKSYCKEYLDYVCVDEMGKLFRPNYVTDHFKLLLQQNGLRHIRFHDLRHSCASLLLSQGIAMKQIQDWLGHSAFATTAINRWMKKGWVEGVNYYGTNLISKESLAEHLASHAGQDILVKSELHREFLDKMQAEQKNSGMAFNTMPLF